MKIVLGKLALVVSPSDEFIIAKSNENEPLSLNRDKTELKSLKQLL